VAAVCLVNRLGEDASKSVDAETPESKVQTAGAIPLSFWDEEGWTDQSADPVAQEKFDKNWDEISHHFSDSRRECWLIDFFCVHPDFQHKGLGPLLLQQAVELGMNEGPKIPVAVISSTIRRSILSKIWVRSSRTGQRRRHERR
jgi:GNAT superfamily N-acetyltransferase